MNIKKINLNKKTICIILAVTLFVSCFATMYIKNAFADVVYIGGSGNAGAGQVGNWTVNIPSNEYIALKLGIDKKLNQPGYNFADEGYYNCYPDTRENYIVLVPKATFKTKTVIADKNEVERNSPKVVYGGEGGAKSALWNLFMTNTPYYYGDIKSLIDNTVATDWTAWVATETYRDIGVDIDFMNKSQGKLFVSSSSTPLEDELLSTQASMTALTLCIAINEAGGNINLKDAAKYFTGQESAYEYIVVTEPMACFRDNTNPALGYWWIDNMTTLEVALDRQIKPDEYIGSTANFFNDLVNLYGCPIEKKEGKNGNAGFKLSSGNGVRDYLFNYWYCPPYDVNGKEVWSLFIASTAYYYRERLVDKDTGETIWEAEFKKPSWEKESSTMTYTYQNVDITDGFTTTRRTRFSESEPYKWLTYQLKKREEEDKAMMEHINSIRHPKTDNILVIDLTTGEMQEYDRLGNDDYVSESYIKNVMEDVDVKDMEKEEKTDLWTTISDFFAGLV